jgi:Ca2+-binding EF-hand superfamily protein
MINIPKYREKDIKKLYEVFYDKEQSYDLNYRKKEFYKVLKAQYNWINKEEFEEMYKIIKINEYNFIFDSKKREISQKYKEKIIKLFCNLDSDNNNVLNIDEFNKLFLKFSLKDDKKKDKKKDKNYFEIADKNKDNKISIDEFIDFITKHNEILENINNILEEKEFFYSLDDKRIILFNDFPGSPLKDKWQPSLLSIKSIWRDKV